MTYMSYGDTMLNGGSTSRKISDKISDCILSFTGAPADKGGIFLLLIILLLWGLIWALTIWFLVMVGKGCNVRQQITQNDQNKQSTQ